MQRSATNAAEANLQSGSSSAETWAQKEPIRHHSPKGLCHSPWGAGNWEHFRQARCSRSGAGDWVELEQTSSEWLVDGIKLNPATTVDYSTKCSHFRSPMQYLGSRGRWDVQELTKEARKNCGTHLMPSRASAELPLSTRRALKGSSDNFKSHLF